MFLLLSFQKCPQHIKVKEKRRHFDKGSINETSQGSNQKPNYMREDEIQKDCEDILENMIRMPESPENRMLCFVVKTPKSP